MNTKGPLQRQLDAARAEVARLETKAKMATCAEIGHRPKQTGGCNAGCDLGDLCCCSVPVHECSVCGDCDYGDNVEARQVRERCAAEREEAA